MTDDEIINELSDQIEATFSLQCDKCYSVFKVQKPDQEDAADHFFAEGFTFKKFKPDKINGEIICGKCH